MLIRLVHMTFQPEKVDTFLALFEQVKPIIETFEGCDKVLLLQNKNKLNAFSTLSYWENENALEKYRESLFFEETWRKTKSLFAEKPLAVSYQLL